MKLDSCSWQDIFIDYEDMNQYCVYDSQTDKIHVSWSIRVDELSLYEQSIKKSYVDDDWSADDDDSLNELNESSSTSHKRLGDDDSDDDNDDINYAIKTKNWQNASKAYISSSEMFKLTFCQSSVRANDLDDDDSYLLDNNRDHHKMSFSQNSLQNFLSLSSLQGCQD